MKKALITGITGQDGAYLTELLLKKGYEVHGLRRRISTFNTERIDHLYHDPHENINKLYLHYGDLTDTSNIIKLIKEIEPDEIYNLGAMSHVAVSFHTPEYTANADGIGALRILEAIKLLELSKKTKVYQASTSELYGLVREIPQNEETPFYPRSPYAIAKLYAFWITINYREAYNIFASNGILFNHESPTRGETFVTRKITRAATRIIFGLQKKLWLGNLSAKRDWGHAKDYVDAMWRILQADKPGDWVVATGVTTEVRTFVKLVFNEIGIDIIFKGKGVEEKGFIDSVDSNKLPEGTNIEIGEEIINVDPKYYRPTEVDILVGDSSKIRKMLGWQPKYDLNKIIKEMVKSDLELAKKEYYLKEKGYRLFRYID